MYVFLRLENGLGPDAGRSLLDYAPKRLRSFFFRAWGNGLARGSEGVMQFFYGKLLYSPSTNVDKRCTAKLATND